MNKYTELSDFEINKKIAYLFLDAGYYEIDSYRHEVMYFKSGSGKGLYREYDPCNNPADAMPIIIENNISITLSDDKGEGKWMAFDGDWYDEYSLSRTSVSYGDNYYRIAMICFLLMKDAENSNGN